MKKSLLAFLLITIASVGYYSLHHLPLTNSSYLELESDEESAAKKLWELKMLMDPATGKIPEGIQYKELAFLEAFQEIYNSNLYKKSRGANWNSRGPWNVGGRTRGFAVDVMNASHIIAGAVSGGIWESKDAGKTWKKVSGSQSHPGCISITQDTRPGKTNLWYALSGEIYGTSASASGAFYLGDGAFKSIDNGATWTPIKSTAGGNQTSFSVAYQGGWRIVTSPVDTVNTCIYMATYGSIYRSTDTGNTWTAVLGAGNDSYFTDVAVSSQGIVYAALSTDGANTKGFFRSDDGVHFTNITPSFLKNSDRTVLDINPNNENEVYFLSKLPDSASGGVKTTNYEGTAEYVSLAKYTYLNGDGTGTGGNWKNLSSNLPITTANPFDKFNSQGGYDLVIRIQPTTNHVVVGGTNLYISSDGFTSPDNTTQFGGYGIGTTLPNFVTYPNHHPDQHDLIFVKNAPSKAYSISDGGVRYTRNINANSVVWEDISMGYITSQFYTVTMDESKAYDQYLLGGLQDNGNYITSTNDPFAKWQMTINGDGATNYIAPNREFYVISTQLGNVRKVILDERGNVLAKRRIDPDGFDKSAYNFINYLGVDPNDNNCLFMPIGKRLARLDNLKKIDCNGDNNKLKTGWTISSDTIKTANVNSTTLSEITTFAFAKSSTNHTMYLGTSNREIYKVENATSGSPTFKLCSTFRLPSGGYVSGMAVDPDTANNVLVCYSNYNINSLFFTRDGGDTWYTVGGNLEAADSISGGNPSVRCVNILVDKNGKRRYFAGTSIGLFSCDSLILGASGSNPTVWQQESPDKIGANVVTDIKIRQQDGYIAVATHGNGVFDSYYTGNKSPTALNTNFISAYPNPTNNEINLSFTNILEDNVKIDIINLLGQRVMTVANQKYSSGVFTIKINTSNLPNGHYFATFSNSIAIKPEVAHFVIIH